MLVYSTIHNKLQVSFYIGSIPDTDSRDTIRIRVDTNNCGVQCQHIKCSNCPLNSLTTKYQGEDCSTRGINYFKHLTKDKFPEWSI